MRLVLVVGQARTGKTTLALRLASARAQRVLVLDPVGAPPIREWQTSSRAVVHRSWPALSSWIAEARGSWRAVLRSIDEDDYAEALRHARYFRHVTIIADEALWFTSSPTVRPELVKTARANGNYGVEGVGVPLWLTAQRPMDLPPDIRSQSDVCISFRQLEPRDLSFLAERYDPDFAEQVSRLGGHVWLSWPDITTSGGT